MSASMYECDRDDCDWKNPDWRYGFADAGATWAHHMTTAHRNEETGDESRV